MALSDDLPNSTQKLLKKRLLADGCPSDMMVREKVNSGEWVFQKLSEDQRPQLRAMQRYDDCKQNTMCV